MANFVVINTLDSGGGSFRDAINQVNALPGADTISFNIGAGGAQTITPVGTLPMLSGPVTIDGTTQPGFAGTPLVTIDGINVTSSSGLRLSGGASTIRGLRITRFGNNGVALDTAGGDVVEGNLIVANGNDGVQVLSSNNTIGGTTAAQRNVIAGNDNDGVRVGIGASGNQIRGNWIGLNVTGAAQGNNNAGVTLFSATNTLSSNVISANKTDGIHVTGASATGNILQGNLIGTNSAGTAAIGNGQVGVSSTGGVRIVGASNNTIGGTSAAARNVISGNRADGIRIEGIGATGNLIKGNYIGVNATGSAAIANANDGVQITNGANTIGGTEAGARNVISGNGDDGIELQSTAANGNLVQGNFLGTNANGTAAIGNVSDGVEIEGAINNTIGGTTAAAGNVLASNLSDGIEIIQSLANPNSSGNVIQGNGIGVGATGAPLGNANFGVHLNEGNMTMVGGLASGAGNTIANNGLDGVYVASGTGHVIRGNSIRGNGGLGIDLGPDGTTPNDANDADGGANSLQNFPIIDAAAVTGGGTLVQLSLRTTPSAQFNVDIYANGSADASGFGEGATYLASVVLNTDAAGNATGVANIGLVGAGQMISATATNSADDTSEFSADVAAAVDTVAPIVTATSFAFDGVTLPAPPHRLSFAFNENVAPSLGANDLILQNLTTGTTVPVGNVALGFDPIARTATFTFPGFANGILPDGRYRATLIAAGVTDVAGNALAADNVVNFFVLAGDANHDGRVNVNDFSILASNFGTSGKIFSQGDFNYDGLVNVNDFSILASRFGTSLAEAAAAQQRFGDQPSVDARNDVLDLLN